jgi:hypothetical protein
VANASRSGSSADRLNDHWQPKRHETVWRAVASRKGGRTNRWRNLAIVPEILPGAARLDDWCFATGRIYASASTRAFASADTIRFTVSVAAASSSACWRCGVDRRRICFASAGPVSLSRINDRLGQ